MDYINWFSNVGSDLHKWDKFHLVFVVFGEGNGTPLQYSCLENPMDGGPTPVFLPGESQGRGSLVVCCLRGHTESDTTEVT